jgi:two-component system, OmpR family, phosphate regulon sensor histidine kinase PhoR
MAFRFLVLFRPANQISRYLVFLSFIYYLCHIMSQPTPQKYALLIAVIAALVAGIFLSLLWFAFRSQPWILAMLVASAVLLVVFLLSMILFRNFTVIKIKPVYRLLGIDISDKKLFDKADKGTLADETALIVEKALSRKPQTEEIDLLKQQEKYRKEFLGNVSHELKTPIFNIQGYIMTLLDGGLEDQQINRSYLEKTEKSINRMISIIDDLESISRLESGELDLKYENFNILALIREVFEMQEIRARQKGIRLTITNHGSANILVHADRKRITDVINNLVINSVLYGKENGQTRVELSDTGPHVLIDVIDNGIGIDEKHLPRVFERFYRVDKGRSRDQGGTGLGLAISKHIIEAHGSRISVRSKLNEGSVFSFTLEKGF